jgi:hypothetical protein
MGYFPKTTVFDFVERHVDMPFPNDEVERKRGFLSTTRTFVSSCRLVELMFGLMSGVSTWEAMPANARSSICCDNLFIVRPASDVSSAVLFVDLECTVLSDRRLYR